MSDMKLGILATFTDRAMSGMRKLFRINEKLEQANRTNQKLANSTTSAFQKSTRSIEQTTSTFGNSVNRVARTTRNAVIGMTAGLTAMLGAATHQAVGFESTMADVNKVVEFQSPEHFKEFSQDILDMSRHIPVAAQGLGDIAAEAGAAGIKLEDNLRFTEFVAKSSVAFDMVAGEAGEAFAKIRNVYGLTQQGLEHTADAVNHLSNNMASKAHEITNFLKRAGGAAPMLKLTSEQMAALGSTFIATGTAPEIASRAVTALGTKLKVGGSRVENALKKIGLSHAKMKAMMDKNSPEALVTLLEAIKKSGKGTEALKGLVGQDFIDDFSKLVERSDILAEAFELVGDKGKYAGISVANEFATRAATTGNNLELFRNNLAYLGIQIGNFTLEPLNNALNFMIEILNNASLETSNLRATFETFSTFISDFGSAIASWWAPLSNSFAEAGSALSGLGEALGMLIGAFTETGEIQSFGTALGNLAAGGLDLLLQGITLVVDGITWLTDTIRSFVEWVKPAIISAWESLTPDSGLVQAFTGIFDGISAFIDAEIKVWSHIFSSFFDGFSSYFDPISQTFGSLVDKLGSIGEKIGSIGSKFGELFASMGASVDGPGGQAVGKILELLGKLAGFTFDTLLRTLDLVATAIDKVMGVLDNLFGWALGKEPIDWNLLIPEMPSFDGIGDTFKNAIDGIFSWFNSLEPVDLASIIPDMPDLSGVSEDVRKAFDTITTFAEEAWDTIKGIFDNIVSAAAALGSAIGETVGKAIEMAGKAWEALSGPTGAGRITEVIKEMSESGWFTSEFTEGLALTEELEKGTVSLDAYRARLQEISQSGSEFADVAKKMVEATSALDQFQVTAPAEAPAQAQMAVDPANMAEVQAQLVKLDAAAKALPIAAQNAVQQVGQILSNVDFSYQGQRMMETLAGGIRARAQAVVAEVRKVTQAVRDHLPSSPAKVGPLSDLHRLKFSETIASSIRPEPMVRAMHAATLATLGAASLANVSNASSAGLASAPIHHPAAGIPSLARPSEAALTGAALGSGGGSATGGGVTVSVSFSPTVTVGEGASINKEDILEILEDYSDELVEIIKSKLQRDEEAKF